MAGSPTPIQRTCRLGVPEALGGCFGVGDLFGRVPPFPSRLQFGGNSPVNCNFWRKNPVTPVGLNNSLSSQNLVLPSTVPGTEALEDKFPLRGMLW